MTKLARKPVRAAKTSRPVMALLDLLGRRWALRILWELRSGQELTFRSLRAACDDVSTSVLNERLRELRDAGIVTVGDGYTLTPRGHRLLSTLEPLQTWARTWATG